MDTKYFACALKARVLFGLVAILIMLNVMIDTSSAADNANELVFLNWSDYMDPELIKEFEQKHGVKIKQAYFETDELRDDMLLATNGADYDLVVSNGLALQAYAKRNWLAPLTKANVPNLKHVDSKYTQAFASAAGQAVPYFWGTTGIVFRQDKIRQPVTSWKQLFEPAEALRGKIVMIKDSRDLIGMALKALGYSANSTDQNELAEVKKLLLAQKPYVKTYSYLSLTEESALVTGKAWMAMIYNGDALMLQEHHPDIAYVVPEEGGNLWIDYLVVMRASTKQELARKFINFLLEPDIAARLAQFVYFATPNKTAEKRLPKDFLADPVIYPSREILEKSEFDKILPARVVRTRNQIFSQVTR
jgi:spermidine/putrescine transport system substrate-binding protein